jgi:hypothetical protein
VFKLQAIPAWEEDDRFAQVAKVARFMPVLRLRSGNDRSWRGYVDIFQDQRYQGNACH